MNPFSKSFDEYSYPKRFFCVLALLLFVEVIQVAIRHNTYFSNPKETKWMFFRDTLALIAFTLLGARRTKKITND